MMLSPISSAGSLVDDPTDATRVAAFKLGELRFQQGQYRQAIVLFPGLSRHLS